MNVTRKGNEILIDGNIKTISDFQTIKELIDGLGTSSVHIVIKDSISLTSSVIGYFTKRVLKDKVALSLSVGDDELIGLLEELGLTELLHVRKIG